MYEFECQKCGTKTEKLMKREEAVGSIKCPQCKGKAVKSWSRSAAHFKGGGWTPKHY
jgi:putative FmdB family regulatory protein